MSLFEAFVLGVLQGVTEFLPVSSTAHLRVVPALLHWDDPGAAFTAVTQLGTGAAVLLYFRADLTRIAVAWLGSLRRRQRPLPLDARLGWYLILATIPIGLLGLAFRRQIETGARDLTLIGGALVVLGLVLLAAERVGRRKRGLADVGVRDAVAVGLAQAAALVPGVSRSGATISAGLFLGLERPAAARFSFLLSVPAVVLSGVFELLALLSGEAADTVGLAPLLLATALAFASGLAAIAFLLRFLAVRSTLPFVAYRVVLGLLVLGLVRSGTIA
jgi:undecaprenyl-diphosphatase